MHFNFFFLFFLRPGNWVFCVRRLSVELVRWLESRWGEKMLGFSLINYIINVIFYQCSKFTLDFIHVKCIFNLLFRIDWHAILLYIYFNRDLVCNIKLLFFFHSTTSNSTDCNYLKCTHKNIHKTRFTLIWVS